MNEQILSEVKAAQRQTNDKVFSEATREVLRKLDGVRSGKFTFRLWEKHGKSRLYINFTTSAGKQKDAGFISLDTGEYVTNPYYRMGAEAFAELISQYQPEQEMNDLTHIIEQIQTIGIEEWSGAQGDKGTYWRLRLKDGTEFVYDSVSGMSEVVGRMAGVESGLSDIPEELYHYFVEHDDLLPIELDVTEKENQDWDPETLYQYVGDDGPLTTNQAAEISGKAANTIRFAIQRGDLVATKHGRDWVIDRADLQEWMDDEKAHKPGPKVDDFRLSGTPAGHYEFVWEGHGFNGIVTETDLRQMLDDLHSNDPNEYPPADEYEWRSDGVYLRYTMSEERPVEQEHIVALRVD